MVLTVNTQLQHATSTRNFNTMPDQRPAAPKLLLSNPRRDQSRSPASAEMEPILLRAIAAHLERLSVLDKAIETAHILASELMAGAKTRVGVEWVSHKTRPGLHPLVHRRRQTPQRKAVWPDGNPRRVWADVLKPGYLPRYVDCMAGQESRLMGPLAEVFDALRMLLDERARLLDTLGDVRRLLTARSNASQPDADPVASIAGLEIKTAGVRALFYLATGGK
jgi:hypothetical protein